MSSIWLFGTSFGTDLVFSNFLNFIFTWDWSQPPCSLCSHDLCSFLFSRLSFTWSHGQEKSLSYYDLFDFGVLFYGRTPTLIFFFHILYTPTPILTIEVLVMRADLEKSMRRPQRMAKREILAVRWRSLFGPNQGLPRLNGSFHQISQYGRLDHVIGNPHRIRQEIGRASCRERVFALV